MMEEKTGVVYFKDEKRSHKANKANRSFNVEKGKVNRFSSQRLQMGPVQLTPPEW